ncbi:PREDICTED: uncharacterized protein LOC105458765 [Wasmannia auropunctata]|uniref:uncharacterized protein LOC105458765 n=1 Tax=Wasmannia auropunctata TaxID=64793 RepID=UPI0005EE476E|nr:PREDICTED: uncharacterized protein LOC105458765 [Wasmannia auropunctata]
MESLSTFIHKNLFVNLDKFEKGRKRNAKEDFDSLTDDDSSSKISKSSNKRKGETKAKEETLMDHFEKVQDCDVMETVETNSDTEESVCQIKNIDDIPMSNEALISEADRIAKNDLLNSSDPNEDSKHSQKTICITDDQTTEASDEENSPPWTNSKSIEKFKMNMKILTNKEAGRHQCLQCGRSYGKEKNFRYHQKHECNQTVMCKKCGSTFQGTIVLRRHRMKCGMNLNSSKVGKMKKEKTYTMEFFDDPPDLLD